MAKACGKYLLACRMAGVAEIKQEVLGKRGPYTTFKDNLQAKEVIVGDGERRRRYILCYNPREAERQVKHRQMIVEHLESELTSHKDQSANAQWAIELLASRRFKRYLRTTKGGGQKWLDGKTFMDGIALGQVTPGPIVITATFVGYLIAFLPGALIGTVSIFTPSLIMLMLAVPYADRIQNNSLFQRGMQGVLVSFVGLLFLVTIRFILTVQGGLPQVLLIILVLQALRMKIDILWVVLAGAALSSLFL